MLYRVHFFRYLTELVVIESGLRAVSSQNSKTAGVIITIFYIEGRRT
jgi:hypothetical protein